MAEFKLTDKAISQLNTLEDDVSDRIIEKLKDAEEWPSHYLERLQGYPYHKLRVGDYRVIVDWEQSKDLIYVHKIRHRRNVYK